MTDRPQTDRSIDRLFDPVPHGRVLSNGHYTVLLSAAGGGFSRAGDIALTAWEGDRTSDVAGVCIYLRDRDDGTIWSATYQPTRATPERYEETFESGKVRVTRADRGIVSQLEVCVSPVTDVEVRRLRLTNTSERERTIEVTTYAELVLHQPAAYASHPAFSRLFVQTEYYAAAGVLLARRRPRSHEEPVPWAMHALYGDGPPEWETARSEFLGRGHTRARPRALARAEPLSGTTGSVLDPVLSLRRVVGLAPGASAEVCAVFGLGRDRDQMIGWAERYANSARQAAVLACVGGHECALRDRLGLDDERAARLQDLAVRMLYGDPALRPPPDDIAAARGGLSDLWKYAIGDGDLIVLAEVEGAGDLTGVGSLVTSEAYWRARGLPVRGVIVCRDGALKDAAGQLATAAAPVSGPSPNLIVRQRTEMPAHDLGVLRAAAHLVVGGGRPDPLSAAGSNVMGRGAGKPPVAPSNPPARRAGRASGRTKGEGESERAGEADGPDLLLDNGWGGFSPDGSEYVIRLQPDEGGELRLPPMPWSNVISNPGFGVLVSERGASCTWSRNSRENRLTPWANDPIGDPHGEALFVRDEESGAVWSPLPGPRPAAAPYEVRHGFGYSTWRHVSNGLSQVVTLSVAAEDALRVLRVQLTNATPGPRRLSLFAYSRLVLGVLPAQTRRSVVTTHDAATGMILARNGLNEEFADAVVFVAAVTEAGAGDVLVTGDRGAFLGRNGDESEPAVVCGGGDLDGRIGAGLDPCAAVQVGAEIPPGATWECSVLLGEATDEAAAAALVAKYRRRGATAAAIASARARWSDVLGAVQVRTPVAGLDVLFNGWLLYQVLSCRVWGRSALYQSGGAYGFRDQLQDALALVHARPDLTRAQILLHAAHQFPEGDVLHWWHPPTGRGTRTRFSDDLLWLPFVACTYAGVSGDWDVFDGVAGFVSARALSPGEDEAYLQPEIAAETDDVYGHCCRAIDRSLTAGVHGLPLMGTGDWNDGMNRVGREGRGESVWLGFFLFCVLDLFVPLCERRGDDRRAARYRAYRDELRQALDNAWDGEWYRRAYYDDGTPLGSASNLECRIDVIAQAWAAISGAAARDRAVRALDAVERELLVPEAGIVRLLAPPFDRDTHDPGYIKGYVPGIRENGGQYTHGAMWVVQASARLGRRQRAAALLEMLGPVWHGRNAAAVAVYQVEPYVVAADIYGVPPHLGRGGWTWYTGSAGWMYRIGIEDVLGIRCEGGDSLRIEPCVPDDWPEYRVNYRLADGATRYEIAVRNPAGCAARVIAVTVDGVAGEVDGGSALIAVRHDGGTHTVEVVLGEE